MMLSKRQIDYFKTLDVDLDDFLDEKAVRNHLIREEFYRLIKVMNNSRAYEKLANDYRLRVRQVQYIVSAAL